SRQPSFASSRAAHELIPARSLPAFGSDQPWHHVSSPDAIFRRMRSCCSLVPSSNSVGASRKMPFWVTRCGAPAREYSSSQVSHSMSDASRPPYSCGQDTTAQPASNKARSHSLWSAKPSRVSPDGSAGRGTFASSHERASARKASSGSVKVRSTNASADEDHRRPVPEESLVDREPDVRALDLALARFASQLPCDLAHLRQRLGGNGLAETRQAAARVHRDPAADRRRAVVHELLGFAGTAQPDVLVPVEL